MATPQTGIFALGTMSHGWLELDARPDADPRALVGLVAGLREPRTTIGGVNLVAGFRPELWAAVAPGDSPPGLRGFDAPVAGPDGYTLPATQHDVVVWIAGGAYDVVFDASRGVVSTAAPLATLAHEMVGWPYHRDLDLTGFVDGTENPTIVSATSEAVIAEGSGAGGSVLLLQQWEHDAMAWERLPIAEQGLVMGRSRINGAELDPLPATSHVARTNQDTFGKIFRRNIPWGRLTRHGTIFVGFSRDRERLDAMLGSMVGRDGERDALTRYARAIGGAYYFVPSSEALGAFAGGAGD